VTAGDFTTSPTVSARGNCMLRVMLGERAVLIAASSTEHETRAWAASDAIRPATVLLAPPRRVSPDWRQAISADWIVVSRRRTTVDDLARIAAWYGLEPEAVLATDRTGPLRLQLSAEGALRWSSLLDRVRVPSWRLPREPPP
jgi:hypothetical protein